MVFAYLRDGGVFHDQESWEQGDRLGTFVILHDANGRCIETDVIAGKRYRGLWIWTDEDGEAGKDYGFVPLLSEDE